MNKGTIIKEVVLDSTPEEVWKAITDKNEMKLWYFDLEAFEPVPGFSFQFWGGTEQNKYLHICQVKEAIKNKKLSYSWRYEGYAGETLVTFELFPEGEKTRLKLTHTGLDTFPAENPDFADTNFNAGWEYILHTSLKNYSTKE